jgi:hypothetical protein
MIVAESKPVNFLQGAFTIASVLRLCCVCVACFYAVDPGAAEFRRRRGFFISRRRRKNSAKPKLSRVKKYGVAAENFSA